jgi:hypothetical protein
MAGPSADPRAKRARSDPRPPEYRTLSRVGGHFSGAGPSVGATRDDTTRIGVLDCPFDVNATRPYARSAGWTVKSKIGW